MAIPEHFASLRQARDDFERRFILGALRRNRGNVSRHRGRAGHRALELLPEIEGVRDRRGAGVATFQVPQNLPARVPARQPVDSPAGAGAGAGCAAMKQRLLLPEANTGGDGNNRASSFFSCFFPVSRTGWTLVNSLPFAYRLGDLKKSVSMGISNPSNDSRGSD